MKKPLAKPGNSAHQAVIRTDHDGITFRGEGDIDYTCPHCGRLLAEKMENGKVWDLVIECFGCKKASEFPRLPVGAQAVGYVYYPEGVYRLTETIPVKRGVLMIGIGAIQSS